VLSTICDTNREIGGEYKSQYRDVEFADSYNNLLKDFSIKAVVIATPAVHHYRMTREALLSKKHVFVEKPLALNVEQGEELVALAEKEGLVLMVGHILRYHPAVKKLKELVSAGEIGKIQYAYSNRLNIGKIRSEENILWSFAPHDISVMLFILDEFPETIYATGGSYLQKQVPDVTLITMDFKGGVKAHVFVSWLHTCKEQKPVVVGDKKMAVFDDVSTDKLFLYLHKIQLVERVPVACKAEAEVVPISMEEPPGAECKHFLECIENNQIPETDGNERLRVLQILQASQESLSSDGRKLSINEWQ